MFLFNYITIVVINIIYVVIFCGYRSELSQYTLLVCDPHLETKRGSNRSHPTAVHPGGFLLGGGVFPTPSPATPCGR